MKHYIFSGCSFTDMHNSWARYICNKMPWGIYTINAKSGAGNTFISTAAITAALQAESRGETPDISIMWSSPSRFEFPIHPNQTPHFNQLFDMNKMGENDFNPGFYFWGKFKICVNTKDGNIGPLFTEQVLVNICDTVHHNLKIYNRQ
jgi:hypothetical protein